MKAVKIDKFGGPEVIVIDELPIPSPGPESCWSASPRQESAPGTR